MVVGIGVAAAREGTLSLVRMLLTCLSIVRSLRNNSAAMILFVLPAAIRRSTCNSRGLKGSCRFADLMRLQRESRWRSCGVALKRSKMALAASNSRVPASWSSSSQHARPIRTRTRAAS